MGRSFNREEQALTSELVLVKDDGSTVRAIPKKSSTFREGAGQKGFKPGERVMVEGLLTVNDSGGAIGQDAPNAQVMTLVNGVAAWAPAGTSGGGGGGAGTGTDASYAAAVLAKGPHGYWKFDEATSPFADSSLCFQAGNNATANGGITTNSAGGPYGSASPYIAFNGTTGYLTFAKVPQDGGLVGDSLIMWIKPTAATFVGLIDTQSGAGGVHRNYNTGQFERQGGTNVTIPNLSTANWTHLAFVISRQSGYLWIYVNGAVATGFPVLFDAANFTWGVTWVLGNINGGANGWFSGSLAHFAHFNREVAPGEIKALYLA